MATEKPWNKYEIVLLIEACEKYKSGLCSRKELISNLSNTLRQNAINNKEHIDKLYRNENGINMQFSNMYCLLYFENCKLRNVSKLFNDMVNLYRTDKSEYNKLLNDAKNNSQNTVGELDKPTLYVGFKKQLSYTNTTPIYFRYRGRKVENIKDWSDLYTKVVQCLISTQKTTMSMLINNKIKNDYVKVSSVYGSAYMIKPALLSRNLYLETSFSPKDIVYKIKGLLDLCRIDYFDLVIAYTEAVKETTVTPIKPKYSYSDFISKTKQCHIDDGKEVNLDRYKEILEEKFTKGYRIQSSIDLKKFKMFWNEKYGNDIDLDDGIIRENIKKITVQYEDMVYIPDNMVDSDTKNCLLQYIVNCFAEGKKAIYYEALYKEFYNEFKEQRINNSDMLKAYLDGINEGKYVIKKEFLASNSIVNIDPVIEVKRFLVAYGEPIKTEDLVRELSYIPEGKIRAILSGTNSYEFIRNKSGEYFHVDIIDITNSELNCIKSIINSAIEDKSFIGDDELIDTVNNKCPNIEERYPFLTKFGLREVIAYKLRSYFSFNGKIVSSMGHDLTMSDVFGNYANSHQRFTLEQLNELKNELDTHIYFEDVYSNAVRISKDEFISKELIHFMVEETDDAIDRFCLNDYIMINDIQQFSTFPYIGFMWNSFLLQYYVYKYSKKYKLIHNGFSAGTPVGAIVKRASPYTTFNELIISVLANSKLKLTTENSLQYLYECGLLARRSFSEIDEVITKATAQRLQKG